MFSAILEKVERLERENAELRQSLNDLSRRLTTIESNKIIFDDLTFSQKLNEMIDERVFDKKTFTDCLNDAIDDKIETVFRNKGLDVVCVGVDHSNIPQFVSKISLICNPSRFFKGRFGFETMLTKHVRVFYLECLIHFKDMIIEYELMYIIGRDDPITFLYKGCFFEIKITTSYCLDAGTPEQTKLFLQAFEDVGIKLLYNGKPVVM